jgi:hypothetical protein
MDYIVLDNGAVTVSQIPPPQTAPGVLRGPPGSAIRPA